MRNNRKLTKCKIEWDFWCSLKCILTWWKSVSVLSIFFLTIHVWTCPAKRSSALLIRVRWLLIVLCSVMSVALFVVTGPPAHRLIKSAGTVPPVRNNPFFSPSPQKGIFSLIPQNDLKDQRRRLSDPLRYNFQITLFLSICRCVWWVGGG